MNSSSVTLRFVRALLWIGCGVALVLLVALAVASACLGGRIGPAIAVVVGVVALTYGTRRLLLDPWARLGVMCALVGGVFGYLSWDEATVKRPVTLENMSPAFSGAQESYDVFMRYGKAHPLGRDFRLQMSQKLYQGPGVWKPADPQWKAWLTANRAELESNWAKLAPERTWWAELNTFDRIADLTPARFDAEIISFGAIRALSRHACAIASLQALDGDGDAAMDTLVPILSVSRKLEPSARTLVRFMIARVVQQLALSTATFVLDTTAVSPAARARVGHALTGGCVGEEGARYLVGMEYAWGNVLVGARNIAPSLFESERQRWTIRCLGLMRPVVLNPRRTLNLYAELTAEMQTLAAGRRAADVAKCREDFFARQGRPALKNFGGTLLLAQVVPAYNKIVESYWKTEDLRAVLQARLQT